MPNFQALALDTAVPQIRAPGTGDGYSFDSGATNLGTWTTTGLTLSTGSLTLTPGTANGVLYLNGSKVATSGSALTFSGSALGSTAAWSVGNGQIFTDAASGNLSGIVSKYNGLAKAYLYFDNSTNLYNLYGDSGTSLAFWTNNTLKMSLDQAGNLGLGVTPSAWISSAKAFQVGSRTSIYQDSANNAVFSFNNFQDATNNKYLTTAPASLYALLNNGNHAWYTAPSGTAGNAITFTQAMTLDAGSRLGVGTTDTANTTVHFANSDPFNLPFRITNTGGANAFSVRVGTSATLVTTDGSQNLLFGTNATERARIDSSGNLGLGVTPSANAAWINFQTQRAVISGGANDRNESSFNSYRTSGQYTYIGNGVATMYQQISGQHIWYQAASGTAGNAITFTQPMTLDASGNLGIGTSSPGARVHSRVSSSGATSETLRLDNPSDSANAGTKLTYRFSGASFESAFVSVAREDSSGGSSMYFGTTTNTFTTAATTKLTLDSSGNLGIGTTSPASRLDVTGAFGTGTTALTIYNSTGASASNIARIDFRVNNTFGGNERVAAIWGLNPNAGANNGGALVFGTSSDGTATTPSERARIPAAGGFVVGTAALATTATDGFLYIPGCAGTPTGVPTALTGRVPLVVDTTNNKLYFYSSGVWRDAGP